MVNQPQKGKIRVWEPLIIGIAAAIGLLAGYNMNFNNDDKSLFINNDNSPTSNLIATHSDGRIEEILRFVENTYVDSIDSEQITLNLIDELLDELDPHSSYITPEELSEHNEKLKGVYRGIGIETLHLEDTFYIARVMDASPSKDLLKPGLAIMSIDEVEVSGNGTPFETVMGMLKDSSKSALTLGIKAVDGSESLVDVEIKKISVPSADIAYLLTDDTAYLKLERFSGNTYEQFIEAIESVIKGKTGLNLVLDLRGNPGGYLPEAIKVLSQLFDKKDKLLTYTEGLNRKKAEYRSTGKSFYNIKKIAVLIDNYSASGSEIVAGAIQDWDRGIIIGQKSYGKGLVQEIFPLKNGGALRLTVAKYYTPSGRLIQKSYGSKVNEFEADSVDMKTKILERNMVSGDGIIPDLIIDKINEDACYEYYYYMDQFVVRQMRNLRKTQLTRASFVKSDYDAFIYEAFREPSDNVSNDCNRQLTSKINDAYQRLISSDIEYAKYKNVNDKAIVEALKFINDSKPTIALLPKEN